MGVFSSNLEVMAPPSSSTAVYEQFQAAIDSGNVELIKDIIGEGGAKILLSYVTWDEPRKESPIHRSINQNSSEVCHYLLSQKKSLVTQLLKHQDFRGETALHRCGWCGRAEIAQRLIKLGAKVNSTNSLGLTPLHLAAERGKLDVVRILIAAKADVNAKSNQGNTPLHRATSGCHNELARILIEAGASPDVVNKKGIRAGGKIDYSRPGGETKTHSQLVARTADAVRSPVHYSARTTETTPRNYDVESARAVGIDMEYYEISPAKVIYGKKIGEGGFGTVYEGIVAGQPVALKTLSCSNTRVHESFRKELDIMCKLRHPNIVLLLGAVIQPDQLCLVMEICRGGSLTSLLKYRPLKVNEVVTIGKHVALAMNWLHTRSPPILHLDLKPANILLTDLHSLHIKVSDFGLARPTDSDSKAIVGTRRFMAPEMMRKLDVTEKADVYSFSILLWQIYTRKKPFSSYKTLKTPQEKNDFAEAVWGGYRPPVLMTMPPSLVHLLTTCWATDPDDRPYFDQVIQWLDQILLHTAFQDRSAQVFWDVITASSPERSIVSWNVLSSSLFDYLEDEGADYQDKSYLDQLQILLCGNKGTTVSMETFSTLANRFGAFSPVERFICQANELCEAQYPTYDLEENHPLYYPFINRSSAVALLFGRPAGTFLLRNPDVTEDHCPFVLSYMSDVIRHERVIYDINHKTYRCGSAQSQPEAMIADFITSPTLFEEFGLKYSTHAEEDEDF